MCSLPCRFAKDGGFAGALDARQLARNAISCRSGVVGRVVAGDEFDFDLRTGTDRAGADSIGVEVFSCGGGRARFAREMSERNLFHGGGAGGRGESGGDSAVRRPDGREHKAKEIPRAKTALGMT